MRRYAPVLLLLAACSSPTAPAGRLQLDTDADAYLPGATITATIVNGADHAAYVSHYDSRPVLLLERRVAGAWTQVAQIPGPSFSSFAGELRIEARGSVSRSFTVAETGEYRLLLHARWEWQDFGDVVVRSRAFNVRYPPD